MKIKKVFDLIRPPEVERTLFPCPISTMIGTFHNFLMQKS